MYNNSVACIKISGLLTPNISIGRGTEQGHPLSPDLFKIFIQNLSSLLKSTGDYPELADLIISHLLWADDLVLLALSPAALQENINILLQFCQLMGLDININKTKVVTFHPPRSKHTLGQLYLGKLPIKNTETYFYLGIVFHQNGTFSAANAELRAKALRALYGLKGNIIKDALSHKSICILFDSLIKPILLYGCQVVGPHSKTIKYISNLSCESDPTLALKYIANDHYEKFHLKFIKWSLSVHSKSSNIGCWGETGRAPLIYEVCKLSMDFFTRAKDSDNVLVSAAFQEQANLDLPWYSNLSKLINKYQFQANLRANAKQSTLITHLMKEEFVDNWKQAKADSPKLEFYNKIKSEFGPEKYLTLVRDPEARKSLTRFRISAHNLFIERGRYETPIIPRADRTCIFCSVNFGAKSIEDEHHVLVGCPLYRTVKIKSGFYPSSDCALVDSLSNQDISPKDATKIAKTVHAILTTNTAYTNYYKSNGFHIIYENCIIL